MESNHTVAMDNLAFDPERKNGEQGIFYTTKSESVLETNTMAFPISVGKATAQAAQAESKTKSFIQKLRQTSYRSKFIQSLSLCFAFWCLGIQIGQRGPSFLDIQLITNTNVEKASTFFTAASVGYLCGSLLGGVLYDRFNKTLLLCLILVFMAVTVAALPLCSSYGLMMVIFWANSCFMSGLDTAGNARLISLWGEKEGRPYMQAASFAFAFGGVISPLLTAPFLAPKPEEISTNSSSIGFTAGTTLPSTLVLNTALLEYNITNDNSTLENNITTIADPIETKLIYAYIISGIVTLLSAIPFMVIYCRYKSQKMKRNQPKKQDEDGLPRDLPWKFCIMAVVLLNLFYLTYCAVEDTFSAYLMTFVVMQLNWSKAKGTQVNAVFWASFAVGRFSGIGVIRCFRPAVLIFVFLASLILSLTGFLLCSHYQIHVGIWIFAICIGLSMSVIYPTGFTWAQENLLNVNGKVTSIILIGASTGTMINPIIMGHLMEDLTPIWYCYLLVGESILCLAIFVVLLFVAKFVLVHKRIITTTTIEVGSPHAESINNCTHFISNNISSEL